jgi:hypothetical protein
VLEQALSSAANHALLKRTVGLFRKSYRKPKHQTALGQALVAGIPALLIAKGSGVDPREWVEVWRGAFADAPEFALPIKLLDVAVRYNDSRDPRALLELPVEERKVLEQLLQIETGERDGDEEAGRVTPSDQSRRMN